MSEALSPPLQPFRRERRDDERMRVLGCEMDLIRPEEVVHQVAQRLEAGRQTLLSNHNLHSLCLCPRNADLREFYREPPFHRCTYLDWRDAFWALAAQKSWRVFYLGGAPGVAERAGERLRGEWPGVTIGVRDVYFDLTAGAAEVRNQIAAFKPHSLLVGMGMEAWVVHNRQTLADCAIFTVGAAFDNETGVQKTAPRWMGRIGLEWLFRLIIRSPTAVRPLLCRALELGRPGVSGPHGYDLAAAIAGCGA